MTYKFKLALNTMAGELDKRIVEVSDDEYDTVGEGTAVTAALQDWLIEGLILGDGDSLTVTEIDN